MSSSSMEGSFCVSSCVCSSVCLSVWQPAAPKIHVISTRHLSIGRLFLGPLSLSIVHIYTAIPSYANNQVCYINFLFIYFVHNVVDVVRVCGWRSSVVNILMHVVIWIDKSNNSNNNKKKKNKKKNSPCPSPSFKAL